MSKLYGSGDLELVAELVSVIAGDEAMNKVCDALCTVALDGEQYGEVIAGLAWALLHSTGRIEEYQDRIGNGEYGHPGEFTNKSAAVYDEFRILNES